MAKVKMSDVKSGSEAVKTLFRRSMSNRTQSWLDKFNFTNDELLEILKISEDIERHKDHRSFYQKLIQSQKGPFSAEVFNAYNHVLFHVDSLLNLIENSVGVNDDDKAKWIDYAILTSSYWFIPNFFMNGAAKKVGIDLSREPFNTTYAKAFVQYKHKISRGQVPDDLMKHLWTVLDTMTEDQVVRWYYDCVSTTYQESAVALLSKYPNTPTEVLRLYYNKSYSTVLAEHPNFPPDLRQEIYQKTGDERFLPQEAKDIFLF